MQQPKFKFGDKVKIKSTGENFIITHMRHLFDDIGIQYWGEVSSFSSIVYSEGELELYQEPQKKKLYAYGTETHFKIEFFDRELSTCGLIRRPEYDIYYPE